MTINKLLYTFKIFNHTLIHVIRVPMSVIN